MKLRNETDTGFTQEGLNLSNEFQLAIVPIIGKAIRNGATVSELMYLLASDVEEVILREHRHYLKENQPIRTINDLFEVVKNSESESELKANIIEHFDSRIYDEKDKGDIHNLIGMFEEDKQSCLSVITALYKTSVDSAIFLYKGLDTSPRETLYMMLTRAIGRRLV